MTGPPGGRTGRTSIFATTPLPVGMMQMTANLQAQANHRAAAAAATSNNNNNHYSYAQDPKNNSNVYVPQVATQDGQQGGASMRRGPPSASEMAQFDAEVLGMLSTSGSEDQQHYDHHQHQQQQQQQQHHHGGDSGGSEPNDKSEEQVDGQDDELSNDPRKRRRMLANRESARRSRRRKQEHVDKLEEAAAELRVANATLTKQAKHYKQQLTAMTLECEGLQRQQLSAPSGSSAEPTPTNVKTQYFPELISSSGSEGRSDGRHAEASRESAGVNRWDSLMMPEEGDQPQYQTAGVKDIMESAFEEHSGGEAAT